MKLTYYDSDPTNFGDELNVFLWPRLLPDGFLDDDDDDLFIGIGSILEDIFPRDKRKYVFGSGYGGYEAMPDLQNDNWEIVFVRGPLTAKRLGLKPDEAICDAAILLRTINDLPAPESGIGTAFMPHFDSLKRGEWKAACSRAGVTFLDPTDPPETLIAMIRGADLMLTEAMHGAIVADTLRTPWVAIAPFHKSHHDKWQDWGGSLDMNVEFEQLPASSVKELITRLVGRGGHRLNSMAVFEAWPLRPLNAILTRRAGNALRRLAKEARPRMSDTAKLDEVTERAMNAITRFTERYSR